jgi:hypothetical protein
MRRRLQDYLQGLRTKAADKLSQRLGWMTRAHPIVLDGQRLSVPLYADGFNGSLMAITDDWGNNWHTSTPLFGSGNIQPSVVRRSVERNDLETGITPTKYFISGRFFAIYFELPVAFSATISKTALSLHSCAEGLRGDGSWSRCARRGGGGSPCDGERVAEGRERGPPIIIGNRYYSPLAVTIIVRRRGLMSHSK